MFASVKTSNALLRFFGAKNTEGISTAIDGRCVFMDMKMGVVETRKETPEGGKGRPKEIPTAVELSILNAEASFKNVKGANMVRAILELSGAVYAFGEPMPFARVMEPIADTEFPKIKLRLKEEGKLPSKEALLKALRVYIVEP